MARKHNRKGIKQPVEKIVVAPESTERKVLLNPETNEYEPTVVTTPAVVKQGRALGSTLKKGKFNTGGDAKPKPKKESK